MNESLNPKQQLQSILSNTEVRGNLTTGDITQIFKIFVNLDQIPKPQGIPQNIVSSSTDKFVGRERDLENLNQQLQRNNQVVIAAVEGMGGVGKTELAIQYSLLKLQQKTYPGGICWIRAREQDIGLQIVNFARTDLDLNPPDDLELPDRVRWCWKRWKEGNTLIVLDDVKDYSDIKPYLPPQPSQFKVLITTRLKLDLPSSMYLAVLSEPDALELLCQLVGAEKVEQELEIAKELCQRLGYLPLALQLVGRYVKKRRISLSEELRRLEEKGLGHPSMEVPENDPSWTLDIKRGVEVAFDLSWDELKKSEFAQELGCLLSLFALAPIPWDLVKNVAVEHNSENLENARVELENLHLIQGNDDNSYQLHQLVREFFRKKQDNLVNAKKQKNNFCSVMVEISKNISSYPTQEEINLVSDVIPHIEEAAEVYHKILSCSELASILIGTGEGYYKSQGLYQVAEKWLTQGYDLISNHPNKDFLSITIILNSLGGIYNILGRYKKAETLYKQALDLSNNLGSENYPEIIKTYNYLGELYFNMGKFSESEFAYLQGLEVRKDISDKPPFIFATILSNLADFYNAQERYEDVESTLKEALKIRKDIFGEEHPDVADSIYDLGLLYTELKRYQEAEQLLEEALDLRKQLLGDKHRDVADSLGDLGLLYIELERYKESEDLLEEALDIRKDVFGQEHPDVADTLHSLGVLNFLLEDYESCEKFFNEALEIAKKYMGKEHSSVAITLNNLAGVLRARGGENPNEIYQKALNIFEQKLGKEHSYTKICSDNINNESPQIIKNFRF